MKRPLILLAACSLICSGFHAGCRPDDRSLALTEQALPPIPDYSQPTSWVALPGSISKPVDVFYVYPTIFAEKNHSNMDIHRDDLRKRARHLIDAQASVYAGSANVFAPYYRQMSMAMLHPEKDMFQDSFFQVGAGDVEAAFDYYLTHLNPDRPFILAGHSQGTMVLIDLMRKRFDDPSLQKRLVAAYLIGYSVTRDDLNQYPWLRLAQHADDTGIIITYNTQSSSATGSPVLLPGAVCINPLSWSTRSQPVDRCLNKGAVFFDDKTAEIVREVDQYVGARIDAGSGALIANPPDELSVGSFPPGVYHKYDYAFWYRNLEQNVKVRVQAFLSRKP